MVAIAVANKRAVVRNLDATDGLPVVTPLQWSLAGSILVAAVIGYALDTNRDLGALAPLITILQIALVGAVAVEAVRTKVPGKLIILASVFVFYWSEALAMASGSTPFATGWPVLGGTYPTDAVQSAYFHTALFQLMLLAGYSFRPRFRFAVALARRRIDSVHPVSQFARYGLAAAAWLPLLLAYRFDLGTTVQALMASRSPDSPAADDIGLIHVFYLFGLFGASFITAEALFIRRGHRVWRALFGVVAAAPYLFFGNRYEVLFIIVPLGLILLRRHHGTIDFGKIWRLVLLVFLVVIVFQLQFSVRALGWTNISAVKVSSLLPVGTTDQFNSLLFAEYLVPNVHSYFIEPPEFFFLTHWVPRAIWPSKREMRAQRFYDDAATQRIRGWNVTPSAVGQYHMNFGLLGVVYVGLLLGLLACVADRIGLGLDDRRQIAMQVLVGMTYAFIISSFRFVAPFYVAPVVFGSIGMMLLTSASRSVRTYGKDEIVVGRS